MKAALFFNLPKEAAEFEMAKKAPDLYSALCTINREIFRPARKHGYADEKLEELTQDEKVREAIFLLEKKFGEILQEHDITIF